MELIDEKKFYREDIIFGFHLDALSYFQKRLEDLRKENKNKVKYLVGILDGDINEIRIHTAIERWEISNILMPVKRKVVYDII